MKLVKNKEPFPHIIIENFYDDDELSHIWKEIEFLSYVQKLQNPSETGTATDSENNELKSNKGIHLDGIYAFRELSNIMTLNRKLFSDSMMKEVSDFHFAFKSFKQCNSDMTLLSYYENSSYYKPHIDQCSFTALTWLFKEPKQFDGGNMLFPEYDYKINVINNHTLIFNSSVMHQVEDIQMPHQYPDEHGKYSGNGRYSISQFCSIVYST